MSVKISIHSTGTGVCALTQKEGDGLTVSFDDQTISNAFLSWKAFRQLLGMKSGEAKPEPRSAAAVPANGQAVATK